MKHLRLHSPLPQGTAVPRTPGEFSEQVRAALGRLLALHLRAGHPNIGERQAAFGEVSTELRAAIDLLTEAEALLYQEHAALHAAQEQLRAAQRRYAGLFEGMPDGYVVSDPQGIIVQANRRAAALLHRSVARLRGQPLAQFFEEDERRRLRALIARLERDDWPGEWLGHLAVAQEAEPRDVACTVAVARAPGGDAEHLHWAIRDVTGQRPRTEVAAGVIAS